MVRTNTNFYRLLKYMHIFNTVFAFAGRAASKLMPFTMDDVVESREYNVIIKKTKNLVF